MLFGNSPSVRLAICLAAGCLGACAQNQYAYVTSSYPMPTPTFSGTKYTLSLSITYPTTLSASSYVLGTQLANDVQGFASSYPSPTDPPEAIFIYILNGVLQKYPQMAAGLLSASVPPVISATGSVTLGATVEVAMGTDIVDTVLLARKPSPQTTRIVRPLIRPAPQDPKAAN
jgi:hypothetical protein